MSLEDSDQAANADSREVLQPTSKWDVRVLQQFDSSRSLQSWAHLLRSISSVHSCFTCEYLHLFLAVLSPYSSAP